MKPLHFSSFFKKDQETEGEGRTASLWLDWELLPPPTLPFQSLHHPPHPIPAVPSTPTSSKDTSFTSLLWEQTANFPKSFAYLGAKKTLFLKGGIDLADHH